METDTCRNSDCIWILFKSYYVVWKPQNQKNEWICAVQFKSYYVVWKPSDKSFIFSSPDSLNRTM